MRRNPTSGAIGGRLFAAAIAACAWIGLWLFFEVEMRRTGNAVAAVGSLLRYFTITTNVIDAILFTAIALGASGFGRPRIAAGLALANALVGVIYWLLLHGTAELTGGSVIANMLLHGVTPILVPISWLLFVRKGALGWPDPLIWSIYPLLYFAFAITNGEFTGFYPYPFIDVAKLGWPQTIGNSIAVACAFIAAGYLSIALDHLLAGSTNRQPLA